MRGMPVFWAEQASPEIKRLVRRHRVAILPVGSTEQHGPHLPVGTDHIVAWEVSKEVAERTDSLLLPLLPYGFSDDHFPMAGTLSIGADTLIHVIEDIATSLQMSGVKHLVIVSGHAGHLTQLEDAAYRVNLMSSEKNMKVHNISPYTVTSIESLAKILKEEAFAHAEELETSLILHLYPKLVDMKKAVREIPEFIPKGLTSANFRETIRILTTSKMLGRDFKTGVLGDATLASKEKGKRIFELFVDGVAKAIRHVTGI